MRLNQSQALISESLDKLEQIRRDALAALNSAEEGSKAFREHDFEASALAEVDQDLAVLRQEYLAEVERLAQQRNNLDTRRRNLDRLKQELQSKRQALEDAESLFVGYPWVLNGSLAISVPLNGIGCSRPSYELLTSSTRERRAALVRDLSTIYRIAQIKDRIPPQFTINGVHLPNSDADEIDAEASATALGFVCHVTVIVASYLDVDLRYPIQAMSSRSTVRDDISRQHQASPVFPLYSYGQDKFRYGYGVFLLNKDIEQVSKGLDGSRSRPRKLM